MQAGKGQKTSRRMNDALGARAVGIVDVIRDEQTRVRVNADAASIAFLLPFQQHQVRDNRVAKDSAPASGSVRPTNAAFVFAIRLRLNRSFQFVDAGEEFATLSRRQCLHLLQNFIRAHRPDYTTGRVV